MLTIEFLIQLTFFINDIYNKKNLFLIKINLKKINFCQHRVKYILSRHVVLRDTLKISLTLFIF